MNDARSDSAATFTLREAARELLSCFLPATEQPPYPEGEQPPYPEGEQQPEPGVRVVERFAEQLADLPQPVADRLRVYVQAASGGVGVVGAPQPGEQRPRQPVGLTGAQPPQRRACLVVLPVTGPVGPVPNL
jgi:hypothetical protein